MYIHNLLIYLCVDTFLLGVWRWVSYEDNFYLHVFELILDVFMMSGFSPTSWADSCNFVLLESWIFHI